MAAAALMSAGSSAVATQSPNVATAPPATFEVASVKLHTSDDQRVMMVAQPGGRFVAANVPLRLVIRTAFQLQDDQIVGGPAWLATDRFDIEARALGMPGAPSAQLLTMLQSLLADRFKLTTHHETRELPIFALERARRDGSLGAGLRPTTCPDLAVDLSQPQPCAKISNGFGSLSVRGMPFEQFTPYLAPYLNRVVVDHTGLDGRYDIDLTWAPEQQGAALSPPDSRATDVNKPSIFTAVQEQLGLKLDSARGMVDVLVIDTLEHPTPN
jgi:bla regulator protein blaR1